MAQDGSSWGSAEPRAGHGDAPSIALFHAPLNSHILEVILAIEVSFSQRNKGTKQKVCVQVLGVLVRKWKKAKHVGEHIRESSAHSLVIKSPLVEEWFIWKPQPTQDGHTES